MDIFDLESLEICPWALREGVILERLDQLVAWSRGRRRPPSARAVVTLVALSTASVYPESTAHGFALGRPLGYDAVEVMVGIDALSQQTAAVQQLSDHHEMPDLRDPLAVPAVHAAGLGHRAVGQARALRRDRRRRRAPTWSSCTRRSAGRRSTPPASSTASPRWRSRPASPSPSRTCTRGGPPRVAAWRCTSPAGTPVDQDYANTTIDLSHAAIARDDVIEMAERLGDRLRHVHLTDGSGSAKDEHLVPGPRRDGRRRASSATSPRAASAATSCWRSTPAGAPPATEREADLRESLEFAREHFAVRAR